MKSPPYRPPARRTALGGQYFRAARPWYRNPLLRLAAVFGAIVLGFVWLVRDDRSSLPAPGGAATSGAAARVGAEVAGGEGLGQGFATAGGGAHSVSTIKTDLRWNHWETEDITITEMVLPVADLLDLLWIDDGDHFVTVEKTGILNRVRFRSLMAERRLKLAETPSSVALSRAGLLVVLPGSEEVLIVDPMSLEVAGSVSVPEIDHVTSSPELDLAFGTGGKSIRSPRHLVVIDLSSGRVVRQLDARELRAGRPKTLKHAPGSYVIQDFAEATVTPDGRYFFCYSNDSVQRFRITGHGLSYEEVGRGMRSRRQLVVSPDSRYVAKGARVYPVTDLQATVDIRGGSVFGFDERGHRIFSVARKKLIVFSIGGKQRQEYNLASPPVSPLTRRPVRDPLVGRILAHPKGKGVLLWAENRLLWVKWPFGGLR